ncbi:MAG: hypothetical protein H0T42_24390 [Deltaproteobacteria bacterium]|nr:hypothetical protein [Deltaproteobacteria bacterium]
MTAGPAARAFVDSMSELAPQAARMSAPPASALSFAAGSIDDLPVSESLPDVVKPALEPVETHAAPVGIEVVEVVEVAELAPADTKKKKSKKGTGKGRGKRRDMATGTPFHPTPVVTQPESVEIAAATAVDASEPEPVGDVVAAQAIDATINVAVEIEAEPVVLEPGQTWSPKMPVAVAPTVPWRINASAQSLARSRSSTARIVPSLVIDDSDPDLAERELEDRASRSLEPAARRSFLPLILQDREDRSARQGGLTLAIVILLIAATLTLSYLMRRPSSSGDGVTQADLVESVDQLA